jgi:4-hydroxybenzoate polyprenyltransferase
LSLSRLLNRISLYTVGVTYIAKTENKVSALNIGIVATIFLPTLYFLFHSSQIVFLPVLCFTAWAIYSVSFAYRSPKRQIGRSVGQLIAGMALLDALVLARTGSLPGVILALLAFSATFYLQRYVKGT